jgi:hypothetical protein
MGLSVRVLYILDILVYGRSTVTLIWLVVVLRRGLRVGVAVVLGRGRLVTLGLTLRLSVTYFYVSPMVLQRNNITLRGLAVTLGLTLRLSVGGRGLAITLGLTVTYFYVSLVLLQQEKVSP